MDLKELGEGFLRLSDQEHGTQRAAPAAGSAVVASAAAGRDAPSTVSTLAAVSRPAVYGIDDKSVVPPVEVSAAMPRYAPPATFARQTYRGLLVVVIDEQGHVESAALPKPIMPAYDDNLLSAAKRWRFRPATRDGIAVKYQRVLEIVLRPQQ
jgi:TonB family protein